MNQTCLITGGAGNLACQLTFDLAERGHRVVLLDVADRPIAPTAPGCQYVRADLTRPADVMDTLDQHRPDVIFHFASLLSSKSEQDRELAWRLNMDGAFSLLEAALITGVKKFFFPSSVAAYGGDLPNPLPEDYPQWPEGLYGVTKAAVERLGVYYHKRHGLDFRCIRVPVVLSSLAHPGAASAYASRVFIEAVRQGQFVFKIRPQTQPSMIYIKDVIRAFLGLMDAPAGQLTRQVYNIQALAPTAQQLADAVEARVPNVRLVFEPDPLTVELIESWPVQFDDASARRDWGWQAKYDLETLANDFIEELQRETTDAPSV